MLRKLGMVWLIKVFVCWKKDMDLSYLSTKYKQMNRSLSFNSLFEVVMVCWN